MPKLASDGPGVASERLKLAPGRPGPLNRPRLAPERPGLASEKPRMGIEMPGLDSERPGPLKSLLRVG